MLAARHSGGWGAGNSRRHEQAQAQQKAGQQKSTQLGPLLPGYLPARPGLLLPAVLLLGCGVLGKCKNGGSNVLCQVFGIQMGGGILFRKHYSI